LDFKIPRLNSLQINHALLTALISIPVVGLLFKLNLITPDTQNGIAIFMLVILKWLAIVIAGKIALMLNRMHRTANT